MSAPEMTFNLPDDNASRERRHGRLYPILAGIAGVALLATGFFNLGRSYTNNDNQFVSPDNTQCTTYDNSTSRNLGVAAESMGIDLDTVSSVKLPPDSGKVCVKSYGYASPFAFDGKSKKSISDLSIEG